METWIYTKKQKVPEMVKRKKNSYKSIYSSQLQTNLQFIYQDSFQDSLLTVTNPKLLSHELGQSEFPVCLKQLEPTAKALQLPNF